MVCTVELPGRLWRGERGASPDCHTLWMRALRLCLCAAGLSVLVSACLGSSAAPSAQVVIRVQVRVKLPGVAATFPVTRKTLTCNPPSGTLSDPAVACKALAAYISRPVPPDCLGFVAQWVTITGTFAGQRVNVGWCGGLATPAQQAELRALGAGRIV
jgi:hypothetical protein